MVDLSTYRARIGSHLPRSGYSRKLASRKARSSQRSRWLLAASIAVLFLFCINFGLLIFSTCVHFNHGPRQFNAFTYHSVRERDLFHKLKSAELFHAKCSSHLAFLDYCRSRDVIPSGLLHTLPTSAARPDNILIGKIAELERDISLVSMAKILPLVLNHSLS